MRSTQVPATVLILAPFTLMLIVGMSVAELLCAFTSMAMPLGVRQWTLTVTVICAVMTLFSWKMRALSEIRGQLDSILEKLDQERELPDDLTEFVHTEIHAALSNGRLDTAVSRAVAPALAAIHDLSLTPVTPLHTPRN